MKNKIVAIRIKKPIYRYKNRESPESWTSIKKNRPHLEIITPVNKLVSMWEKEQLLTFGFYGKRGRTCNFYPYMLAELEKQEAISCEEEPEQKVMPSANKNYDSIVAITIRNTIYLHEEDRLSFWSTEHDKPELPRITTFILEKTNLKLSRYDIDGGFSVFQSTFGSEYAFSSTNIRELDEAGDIHCQEVDIIEESGFEEMEAEIITPEKKFFSFGDAIKEFETNVDIFLVTEGTDSLWTFGLLKSKGSDLMIPKHKSLTYLKTNGLIISYKLANSGVIINFTVDDIMFLFRHSAIFFVTEVNVVIGSTSC
jgi:hypothetical protein